MDKLLIIEDESSVAKQLKWSLGDDYDISIAEDAEKARQLLRTGVFPVITLDLGLPPHPSNPKEGMKLLGEMSNLSPHTKVIIITGNSEKDNAVQAIALGAADFCTKPIDLNVLQIILRRTFGIHELESTNRKLQHLAHQTENVLCGMIGISEAMTKVFSTIRKISATNYPVLITGDSGTGKEMAAHAIHELSPRSNKPLIIINCGAIPENLLESELFGHEKGAFTGAVARKIGKFEQADEGTVFLDEIGELPLAMQVKLLRCLQESTIERIGGTTTIHLNVRIVAATNIDLRAAIKKGTFREDLFFRLNVVPVKLPPLIERSEDILFLAQKFLKTETRLLNAGRVILSPASMAALSYHNWPGNVRELQNRIRRAISLFDGKLITPEDLGLEENHSDLLNQEKLFTLQEARTKAEINCIQKALALTGNNISQAAKLLETSRPTLHDLINKHMIATD